jgi:hypothetical protein
LRRTVFLVAARRDLVEIKKYIARKSFSDWGPVIEIVRIVEGHRDLPAVVNPRD